MGFAEIIYAAAHTSHETHDELILELLQLFDRLLCTHYFTLGA